MFDLGPQARNVMWIYPVQKRKWGSCSTTKTLTPRAHPGGGPKEAEWPLEYPEVPRERA